jgi:hypothetical protein
MFSTWWASSLRSIAGGMPTSAASSSRLGTSAIATTAPTTATFAKLLTVSNSARLPKRFFAPVIGLSFFGSGLIASADGFHRTCATLVTTPARSAAAATGPAASASAVPSSPKRTPRPSALTTFGVATSVKPVCMAPAKRA